jgi:predicted small lipoprotein YifL
MRVAALLLSGLSLLLAACGQKGPLYLPDKHAAVVTSAPAPPAPAAPPKKTTDQDQDQDGDSAPPPQ